MWPANAIRSAEAKCPESQKVEQQIAQCVRSCRGTAQHRRWLRRFWVHIGGLLFATLAKFVECCLEARGQFICWAPAPIVEKDDGWLSVEHVVMDCHDVQSVSTEGLEGWRDFGFEHGHVTGDGRVFVGADERCPGV